MKDNSEKLGQAVHKEAKKALTWDIKNDFMYFQEHKPPANILGDIDFDEAVCSFTQFDPLKLVLIGNIDHTTRIHQMYLEYDQQNRPMAEDQLPEDAIKIIQKQQEDIVEELQKRGIKVVRTGYVDHSVEFEYRGIKTNGFNNFNPRDLIFAYDDSLYEFPCHAYCRKREIRGFEWLEKKLHRNGSKIYKAPEDDLEYLPFEKEEVYKKFKSQRIYGDAANLVKLGLDILFLISWSGSLSCYRAFRQMMENRYKRRVRVHPILNVYDNGVHIDTAITVIGFNKKIEKNIVIVNGRNVTPKTIPVIFRGKNWRVIEIVDIEKEKMMFQTKSTSSEMLAINILAITPDLCLMSDLQFRIQQTLQHYGIQTLKMPHTYGRQVLGGYHCMSNDLKRQDTYGFGQILRKEDPTPEELSGLFDPELLSFLESKGDLEKWVEICNEEGIFPNYLTEHMSDIQKQSMQSRHKSLIKQAQ